MICETMRYLGGTSLFRGEAGSGLNSIPCYFSLYQGLFPTVFYSVTEIDVSCVFLPSINSLNLVLGCYHHAGQSLETQPFVFTLFNSVGF